MSDSKKFVKEVPRMRGFARKERRRVSVNTNVWPVGHPKTRKSKNNPMPVNVGDAVPCLVKRSMAEACDIKNIVDKYRRTGVVSHIAARPVAYGDVSELPAFDDAMNMVVRAQELFEALPAEIRDRFGNNPAAMIKFLEDPKNKDEAVKLGLFKKPVEPVAPVTPTPTSAPDSKKKED